MLFFLSYITFSYALFAEAGDFDRRPLSSRRREGRVKLEREKKSLERVRPVRISIVLRNGQSRLAGPASARLSQDSRRSE
jgi:hypothetical protein